MADIDLPVFSFRPDWREGITERLAWRTNVLRAEEGAEQRQPTRLTPRRGIEADFLLVGPERTFYDLFMHRLGAQEVMVPLHWDVGRLTVATEAGVTDRLEFDTRWTEFAPGLAILQQKSALTYETVEIVAVDDNGIDLADPVLAQWPKGTRVTPLRRFLIEDMGSLSHPSAKVARVSAQFIATVANPWTPAEDDAPTYLGLPVLLNEPNWVENLDAQLARDAMRLDNDTGIPYQLDPTGRANVGQAHRWFLKGRESLASYRDLIYRHSGRAGSFWLPTFKGDLDLAASALSAATQIVVQNVGLQYCDVPTEGREHLAIFLKNGTTLLRHITDTDPGDTAATEKIDLGSSLGLDLSPGQVRKISFMDTARFDQDDFEMVHHTESTGFTDASAVFRTFKNSRNPAGAIDYPIPPSVMSSEVCGEDIESPCYTVPEWAGWDYELTMVAIHTLGLAGFAASLWNGPDGFISGTGGGDLWSDETIITDLTRTKIKRVYGEHGGVGTGIGDWSATYDPTIVDYIPGVDNMLRVEFYFRGWRDETPTLVGAVDYSQSAAPRHASWSWPTDWMSER